MTTGTIDDPRVEPNELTERIAELRALSIRALGRMYDASGGKFVWCVRRGPTGDVPEGVSGRYTAIVLIGLATETEETVRRILGARSAADVCGRLLDEVDTVTNLGDVGLTLWAAAALEHRDAPRALDRLRSLDPVSGSHPTVEVAWALTSLSAHGEVVGDAELASRIADRLVGSFNAETGIFPHWPLGVSTPAIRGHVACFADLVYPTQALAYHHLNVGDRASMGAARRCAEVMCQNQGPAGQWWWHFDVRTGRVVEGYPVYAVHQNSMAPMALLVAEKACDVDCRGAIRRGMDWLASAPELDGGTLIDRQADLVWRKVGRSEPGKLSRAVQAMASRIHPSARVPGVGTLCKPGRIDCECRPYHLGWILHAWPTNRPAA